MSSLQYIGARYVPAFYENPDTGDMSWKSGVGYEPLTVVTYNSDTYTSKIPVPSSVGNPASNPTYWAKTADFNAALVSLQNQVNNIDNVELPELQSEIDNINDNYKNIIFIGDSYTGQMQWVEKMASILGLTLNTDYWTYSAGGEGFSVGTDGNGFLDDIKHLESDLSGIADTINHIVVMGGANDLNTSNVGTIQAGLSSFIAYCRSHYTNAKIHVGFIGVAKNTIRPWANFYNTLYAYQSAPRYSKMASYMNGVEKCTHWLRSLMVDDIHPNPTMGTFASYAYVNALITGDCSFSYTTQNVSYTNTTFNMDLVDGHVYARPASNSISIPSGFTIKGTGRYTNLSNVTELETTTAIYFNDLVRIPSYLYDGTNMYPCDVILLYDKMYVVAYNNTNSWADITAGAGSFVYMNNTRFDFDNLILA